MGRKGRHTAWLTLAGHDGTQANGLAVEVEASFAKKRFQPFLRLA
jgi:hypothetical protein